MKSELLLRSVTFNNYTTELNFSPSVFVASKSLVLM